MRGNKMMQKILLMYLTGICLFQDVFAATVTVADPVDYYSPHGRSSARRSLSFSAHDAERIIAREGSVKRSRENADEPISPSGSPLALKRRESIPRPAGTIFEFTDAHKDALRRCGILDLQINRIELLQTIFFRSPHGDRFDPQSYLSESELDAIYTKLDSEEVRELVRVIKSLYDKKIPLSAISPNTVYTPAARLSCNGSDGPKAKEISATLAACSGIHVEHVTGRTFIEEETPETPEERAARHALKAQIFKTLEAQRGISDASRLSELTATEQIWSNYFEYMQLRMNAIDQHASPKIRYCEIEESFKELVGCGYSSITVGDSFVYFRKEDIDLARRSEKVTNEQLLCKGLAPFGADGKPMNLHHLTRRQPGIFVLLTEAFHQKHTALLHFRSEKHMRQPQPVDRVVVAPWKKLAFTAIKEALVPTEAEAEFDPAVRLFSETDLLPQDEETT